MLTKVRLGICEIANVGGLAVGPAQGKGTGGRVKWGQKNDRKGDITKGGRRRGPKRESLPEEKLGQAGLVVGLAA